MYKLEGIIVPVITPLLEQDKLDEPGLARLLERMIKGKVHGCFLLGTTGEAPSLSYSLREEFVKVATSIIAGRIPVLVGISDTSYTETIQFAQKMDQYPIDAYVLTTPYYYPADGNQIRQYIRKVVRKVNRPVVLYNMPENTKVMLELDTIKFARDTPEIIGVKDSSGDLNFFQEVCQIAKERTDFGILIGPEAYLADAIRRGGNGGVSGGANLYPELFVTMYQAAKQKKAKKIVELQQKIELLGEIYKVVQHGGPVFRGLKIALHLLDICSDLPAQPFTRPTVPMRKKIDDILKQLFPEYNL